MKQGYLFSKCIIFPTFRKEGDPASWLDIKLEINPL